MFESRSKPSTDPLIVWLTGGTPTRHALVLVTHLDSNIHLFLFHLAGPGCSSLLALFTVRPHRTTIARM
jgi:carboxypeptidase C (cathepsin A)